MAAALIWGLLRRLVRDQCAGAGEGQGVRQNGAGDGRVDVFGGSGVGEGLASAERGADRVGGDLFGAGLALFGVVA